MKFEFQTEKDQLSKALNSIFLIFTFATFLIIFSSISINLKKISKHYEINYLCKLLKTEKSSFDFKELSKLSNQTSKKKMWDLCNEIIK